ncbi:MAG: hypothetical protein ACOC17_00685 [Halanaerobium sp.]
MRNHLDGDRRVLQGKTYWTYGTAFTYHITICLFNRGEYFFG